MPAAARLVRLIALASALVLAGCANPVPYQPATIDGRGYSELRLETNRYQITVTGNYATSAATLERYVLFRAAELTLESGHAWFRLVERTPGVGIELTSLGGFAPGPGEGVASRAAKREGDRRRGRQGGGQRGEGRRGHRHKGHGHKGHRHKKRRKKRSRYYGYGYGYGFGLYYWPYYGGYAYSPPPPTVASAEILVFPGQKPPGDPMAYDAADLIARLAGRI